MKKAKITSNNEKPSWINVEANGKTSVNRQELYRYLKEKLQLKITEKGNYYIYDGKMYKLLSRRDFQALIKENIPARIRTKSDWSAVYDEFNTDFPNTIESSFDADENIIAFENGVLELDTLELKDFSDQYLITRILPCKYKPNSTLDDSPVFKKYIYKLVNEDEKTISFLMEYIGAVISNVYGYRFKRMLMLIGNGNTGKSQYRELLINLVGENNCTSIELRKLQERFGTSQLYRKRFAGSGDMSNMDISELNIAKELTGGDEISAEFKGKDSFTFKYRGFLGFNANDLPFFRGDRGSHVYERFNIVRCDNVIPSDERDPHLLDKMLREKDSIASTAVIFLKDAIDRGYKFTESEGMKKERRQYEIRNNSLFCFIDDCCELTYACAIQDTLQRQDSIKRSVFNRVYKTWCRENSVKPERDREIPVQLEKKYCIFAQKSYGEYYYPLRIKHTVFDDYNLDIDGFLRKDY